MSFRMGGHLAVVLNDFETIKEAFCKSGDKFSDRPKLTMFENIHPDGAGKLSVVNTCRPKVITNINGVS